MKKIYILIFLSFIVLYIFALWYVDSNVEFAIMRTFGGNQHSIIKTIFYDKYEILNQSYKVIKFDRIIVFIYSIIFLIICLIKKRAK